MFFYIDPGTGSMLFTILIGVISAAIFFFRNAIVKMRFFLHAGKQIKTDTARMPYVIFSDSKRYWTIFKPICDEMDRRGMKGLYITSSPDDPMLSETWQNIKAEFGGDGNKTFARMNMIKADFVLTTTPGLDIYQWKRSRDVKWYAHVLHACNDVTGYRMFGIDYFDALLLSGEYQIDEVRELEQLRDLPQKETVLVGLPHMDWMRKRLQEADPLPEHPTTILLAPSWGPSSILNRFGKKIIDSLLKTDYHIIIRPHPQSFESDKELMEELMRTYPNSDRLEWNRDTDNFDALNRSDILISDFSGVIFDFSLVFERPVIYADVSFDVGPYDAWWLERNGRKMWTFSILDKIGIQLKDDHLDHISSLVEQCLHATELRDGIEQARKESWVNIGHSVESIVDYMEKTRERLLTDEQTKPNDNQKRQPAAKQN